MTGQFRQLAKVIACRAAGDKCRHHMLDFTDSQLTDDELVERIALDEAEHEFEKWQDRMRLKKAGEFRWRGGMP